MPSKVPTAYKTIYTPFGGFARAFNSVISDAFSELRPSSISCCVIGYITLAGLICLSGDESSAALAFFPFFFLPDIILSGDPFLLFLPFLPRLIGEGEKSDIDLSGEPL